MESVDLVLIADQPACMKSLSVLTRPVPVENLIHVWLDRINKHNTRSRGCSGMSAIQPTKKKEHSLCVFRWRKIPQRISVGRLVQHTFDGTPTMVTPWVPERFFVQDQVTFSSSYASSNKSATSSD